jgi:hypothetical protein
VILASPCHPEENSAEQGIANIPFHAALLPGVMGIYIDPEHVPVETILQGIGVPAIFPGYSGEIPA